MTNKHLRIFEEKVVKKLDYDFLKIIKDKFPSNNAYFLVCFSETIFTLITANGIKEEASFEDVLEIILRRAESLYQNANISENLSVA